MGYWIHINPLEVLVMKGIVVQFRRGRHRIHEKHYLLDIGLNTRDEANKMSGKIVEWKSPSGKIIRGKISSAHGNSGLVRAIFEKGLPGQAITNEVEIRETGKSVEKEVKKEDKEKSKKMDKEEVKEEIKEEIEEEVKEEIKESVPVSKETSTPEEKDLAAGKIAEEVTEEINETVDKIASSESETSESTENKEDISGKKTEDE